MLYVSDCCFCFDLRSGALLLAWITTLTALFGFNCSYLAFEKAMGLPVISADTSDDKLWSVLQALLACASFFVIFTSNVLMIMGIHMRKAHLVKVWLVVTLLQIFGGGVLALHFATKFWWMTDNFLRSIVATFIMIVLYSYWWISVYSLYVVIKAGKPIKLEWKRLIIEARGGLPFQELKQ